MTVKSSLISISTIVALTSACVTAHAALPLRTYVSNTGSDSNNGSISSPCLTFTGAFSKTATGGEIDVLNPGNYGQLTITHSITINGIGTNAAVTIPQSQYGITINAGASDTVVIEHIAFNGGLSLNTEAFGGIVNDSCGLLTVDDCSFTGVINEGVATNLTATGHVAISDCKFACVDGGILTEATSATAYCEISSCSLSCMVNGIGAFAGALVDVKNCQITKISGNALDASTGGIISADGCALSANSTAAFSGTGSRLRLSNCDVFNNSTGIFINGGIVSSSGDNKFTGNTTAGAPSATINVQ